MIKTFFSIKEQKNDRKILLTFPLFPVQNCKGAFYTYPLLFPFSIQCFLVSDSDRLPFIQVLSQMNNKYTEIYTIGS